MVSAMSQEPPTLRYHQETAHARGRIAGRPINWQNQPHPFKLYRNIPVQHLSHDLAPPDIPLDQALDQHPLPDRSAMPVTLAAVLNLAAGITLVRSQTDGTAFHFRAAPSAGALYPVEVYVALQNVNGFNDGLYHYCPLEHTLSAIREGAVFEETDGEPVVRFYLTSVFHRSAWKYGQRAFRYCLLDTGHMAHALLVAGRIHGLPAEIDYDFNDAAINRFLAVDPRLEGCLAQVHGLNSLGRTLVPEAAPLTAPDLAQYSRTAAKPDAPELLLEALEATASFARCPVSPLLSAPLDKATPLPAPHIPSSTTATIKRRRSRRNFVAREGDPRNLVDVISLACRGATKGCTDAVRMGFLAAPHSGLTPGLHHVDRAEPSTTLVTAGDYMGRAARVCLDQGWLERSALHVVFSADLEGLHATCGPRAYRYAHLEAGRIGQALYLAATAKNMGACGIGAFFDNEAAHLLGLPQGTHHLYSVALGPVRK